MGNENDLAYFKYSELDAVSSLGTSDKLVVFEGNVPKQGSTIANVLALAAVTDIEDGNGDLSITRDLDVTRNADVGGTLGVTGVTTLTAALNANGGIAVDSTAFTVADTSGNVATAGTLGVTGVSTLTGGATIGGALIQGGTGAITATSGAGAVAVTGQIHEVTTTGTGDALTLANGTAGQRLCVIYVAEGAGSDTAIITPTTLAGGSTITLNALGDSADLVYSATGGWYVLGLGGTAAVA